MNIVELDPFDDSQLEKIKKFEEKNECLNKQSENIMRIRKNISKEEYYDSNKNDFEKILIIEKNNENFNLIWLLVCNN